MTRQNAKRRDREPKGILRAAPASADDFSAVDNWGARVPVVPGEVEVIENYLGETLAVFFKD